MRRLSRKEEQYFLSVVEEVAENSRFPLSKTFCQHGSTSVYAHSLKVAYAGYRAAVCWNLPVRRYELIRGALLHDYFLYDWHRQPHGKGIRNLHGFRHPEIALENAGKEYRLSERERDIIRKHMWPLTMQPPGCREAWIVTAADKYCSLLETLRLRNEKRRAVIMAGLKAASENMPAGKRAQPVTGDE